MNYNILFAFWYKLHLGGFNMKKIVQKLAQERKLVPIVIIILYIAFGIFEWAIGEYVAVALMTYFAIILVVLAIVFKLEDYFCN